MPVYRRKTTQSQRWYYKFQIDGVLYKRTIPTARTKRQAEEAERQARQDVHEGKYSSARPILFSDFVNNYYLPWTEKHHQAGDVDRTECDLLIKQFGDYSVGQISPMLIDGLKLKLAKSETQYGRPFAPSSINLALAHLSMILNMAVRYNVIKQNPCKGIKKLPVPKGRLRYLLPEEEESLLTECAKGPSYLKPLVQIAIWTGFRQGELVNLRRSHVDFGRNLIFVMNPKWKNDPRKTEGFPMSKQVRILVSELCQQETLFNQNGKPITQAQADSRFRAACRAAGIYDLNFHALRHTFGTRLADKDVNLKKIARLMGHANTRHTEIYVHTTDSGLADAVEIATLTVTERSSRFFEKAVSSL